MMSWRIQSSEEEAIIMPCIKITYCFFLERKIIDGSKSELKVREFNACATCNWKFDCKQAMI